MSAITVVVHGALGKVGQVMVNAICRQPEIKLVGAVDLKSHGDKLVLEDGSSVPFSTNLEQVLATTGAEVVIDFSLAAAVLSAVRIAARRGVHMVTGTTGLTSGDIEEIDRIARENQIGVIMATNFALGAVLMMHFARLAAKYMDYAEIIELHHNQKADAPSGTALNTAKAMADSRARPFLEAADGGRNYPSRGEKVSGIPVHSVRLPGLMAHQEVILGGPGQTLTIRHDAISRECFVPGVLLAVQEVVKLQGLIQGLDKLLKLE